jgi:hypothetical protein
MSRKDQPEATAQAIAEQPLSVKRFIQKALRFTHEYARSCRTLPGAEETHQWVDSEQRLASSKVSVEFYCRCSVSTL